MRLAVTEKLQQYRRPFTIPRAGVTKNNMGLDRASQSDCAACAHKARVLSRTAASQGAEKRA